MGIIELSVAKLRERCDPFAGCCWCGLDRPITVEDVYAAIRDDNLAPPVNRLRQGRHRQDVDSRVEIIQGGACVPYCLVRRPRMGRTAGGRCWRAIAGVPSCLVGNRWQSQMGRRHLSWRPYCQCRGGRLGGRNREARRGTGWRRGSIKRPRRKYGADTGENDPKN